MLVQRYTGQATSIDVRDRGCGGEKAGDAMVRFLGVLAGDAPQVVLLMEGSNDLNDNSPASVGPLVQALRSMVIEAQRRGIVVLIGTLPPQRAGGSRALAPRLIPTANDAIRAMAAGEGAILVDVYNVAFNGSPDPFIDTDGMHPTNPDGHRQIAQAFFTVIASRLETPRTALTWLR